MNAHPEIEALQFPPAQTQEHELRLQRMQQELARLERELEAERAARRQAERADSSKDEFLATVAHELKSPVSAIVGWTHMLRQGTSPEDLERGLDVIEQSAAMQARLVDDLLDMSRIVSGRLRLDPELLPLGTVVEAALACAQPAADEKGVCLRQALDTRPARVRGDRTRLQQVMANLLNNAIKFTPEGGVVDVIVQSRDGQGVVVVSDSGAGIAPEFLPHVFDRFEQESGTLQGNGGLGLGLAIARQLVALHGGTIAASSEGAGRGAAFTVRLPLA